MFGRQVEEMEDQLDAEDANKERLTSEVDKLMALEKEMWPNRAAALAQQEKRLTRLCLNTLGIRQATHAPATQAIALHSRRGADGLEEHTTDQHQQQAPVLLEAELASSNAPFTEKFQAPDEPEPVKFETDAELDKPAAVATATANVVTKDMPRLTQSDTANCLDDKHGTNEAHISSPISTPVSSPARPLHASSVSFLPPTLFPGQKTMVEVMVQKVRDPQPPQGRSLSGGGSSRRAPGMSCMNWLSVAWCPRASLWLLAAFP